MIVTSHCPKCLKGTSVDSKAGPSEVVCRKCGERRDVRLSAAIVEKNVVDQCALTNETCFGHGTCVPETGICTCEPGFAPPQCATCVPDCRYRVGFEERRWTVGELLIFDDSIEHEARNDSDELRVVLIFDVWNPLLEPAERDMVRALSRAEREFGRTAGQ